MSLFSRPSRRHHLNTPLFSLPVLNKRATATFSNDLFVYTDGRFLFNEEARLAERRLHFNADALIHEICHTTGHRRSDLVSFKKLAEGGFNRVFEARFADGNATLACLPYPSTIPRHLTTASEVATLDLLRAEGLPVPRVLDYSSSGSNSVGSEYILLEKVPGTSLGSRWYHLEAKDKVKIMRQIVNLEARWLSLKFPASGSIYYKKDLTDRETFVDIPKYKDRFVVGPTAEHTWYGRRRGKLSVDRGLDFLSCFQAPAKREAAYCEQFGKPRLHVERHLRLLHEFKPQQPSEYLQTLSDFLQVSPFLEVPASHPFARPILRHPDFSPNNIMVSDSNEITGIIDWQHSVILPLCLHSEIPRYFQNWGDPLSEAMVKPETRLPENIDSLELPEQERIRDEFYKRLLHFYYVAMTLKSTPDLYSAIRDTNTRRLRTLFERTNVPWEGDTTSLKYALIQIVTDWPFRLNGDLPTKLGPTATKSNELATEGARCPVAYSNEEIEACIDLYEKEQRYLNDVSEMQEHLGIDPIGWLPEERLERSKQLREEMKTAMLDSSES